MDYCYHSDENRTCKSSSAEAVDENLRSRKDVAQLSTNSSDVRQTEGELKVLRVRGCSNKVASFNTSFQFFFSSDKLYGTIVPLSRARIDNVSSLEHQGSSQEKRGYIQLCHMATCHMFQPLDLCCFYKVLDRVSAFLLPTSLVFLLVFSNFKICKDYLCEL